MIEYLHRCKNCSIIYRYQASGEGCGRPNNHRDFCPDCMELINKALKKRKPVCELRWVDTKEVTEKQLMKWHKEDLKKMKERSDKGELVFHRVFPSLYKWDGDKHVDTTNTFEVSRDNKCYHYSYWTESKKKYSLRVAKEYDFKKKKIVGYWRFLSNTE